MKRPFVAIALASAVAVAPAAAVAVAPAAVATTAASNHVSTPDTYVAAWDAIGTQAFSAAGLSPTDGHIIFAYVSIAVYDSVMAVNKDHRPFAVHTRAPAGTSAEAAVAAAAHRVLGYYLSAQGPTILDPAYITSLATIPPGQSKDDGVALGEKVADAVIAMRADDGFRVPVTYTPPDPPIPGAWLPTATTPPIGTYLPAMTTFALRTSHQFRPDGPPGLRSKRWARDYNEVKEIGSIGSTTRMPDETTAAKFWAEPPVQQARGSFRKFVTDHGLDISDASRFMAMESVTYADALIACFDAKYKFAFWRPITAIRAGDTDHNDATLGDPMWTPLLPSTPNHPEYPSAHSCITPAGGQVAARFLGTSQIDFTVPSLTGLGDRTFATVDDLATEVSNARIWGGIHFRSAVVDGVVIANKTTRYVLAHNFKARDCRR